MLRTGIKEKNIKQLVNYYNISIKAECIMFFNKLA